MRENLLHIQYDLILSTLGKYPSAVGLLTPNVKSNLLSNVGSEKQLH